VEYLYSVVAGTVPLKNHLGSVKFFPEGEEKTKIVWELKFTPSPGFGKVMKSMMKGFLKSYLSNFERTLQAEALLPPMATEQEVAEAESKVYTSSTSVERILSGPVPLVYQKFREVVWLRNGGLGPASWTTVLQEGEEGSHVGEVRYAAHVAQEKILRTVENELIVYSVIKGVPVHTHLGKVAFTPEGSDKVSVITLTFDTT
jgi:hypothetical protein